MAQPRSQRLTDSTHSQSGALRAVVRALAVACSLFAAPSLVGCRSVDNAQVDLLERELRQQEDYIYELEDYLMEYSEKLRQARMNCQSPSVVSSEPAKKKPTLAEPELVKDPPRRRPPTTGSGTSRYRTPPVDAPTDSPAAVEPSSPTDEATEPAADPAPEPETTDPAELEPPDLEIGDPSASLHWQKTEPVATPMAEPETDGANAKAATADAAGGAAPGDEAPPFIPDPVNYQVEADATEQFEVEAVEPFGAPTAEQLAEEPAPDDAALELPPSDATLELPPPVEGPELPPIADPARAVAAKLQVVQVFTQPADEDPARVGGLLVVVEALNAMDEPVDAAGTISLMIMARDEQGVQRRVDRWDFTAEETQAAWQSSRLGDGLHLQLPLGATELPAGPLELWARLVNGDEQKLLTQLPFDPAELVAFEDAMAAPVENVAVDAAAENVAENGAVGGDEPGVGDSAGTQAPAPVVAVSLPAPTWRAASREIVAPQGESGGAGGGWTSRGGEERVVGERGSVAGVVADAAKREAAPPTKTATSASTWTRRTK